MSPTLCRVGHFQAESVLPTVVLNCKLPSASDLGGAPRIANFRIRVMLGGEPIFRSNRQRKGPKSIVFSSCYQAKIYTSRGGCWGGRLRGRTRRAEPSSRRSQGNCAQALAGTAGGLHNRAA